MCYIHSTIYVRRKEYGASTTSQSYRTDWKLILKIETTCANNDDSYRKAFLYNVISLCRLFFSKLSYKTVKICIYSKKNSVTYNNLMSFCWPSLAYSMILFNAPSETVVNGTLSRPSGPSTKTATTGLFRSFCHINVPDSRSSVTVSPLPLPVKCRYPVGKKL